MKECLHENQSLILLQHVSLFSLLEQVVGTCKIKIKKNVFVLFYSQNVFYINLPLEQHSLSEKKKRVWEKKNTDQKYLDILHTWDSLTKMQQIYHWNFQTILPPTKDKKGKMVTVSTINWENCDPHSTTSKLNTEQWYKQPGHPAVYRCARLHTSVIKRWIVW